MPNAATDTEDTTVNKKYTFLSSHDDSEIHRHLQYSVLYVP